MDIDRNYIQAPARQALPIPTPQQMYDLWVLALLALLLPGLLLLPSWLALLRIPLGIAMALLAPGYALVAALFPRRGDLDMPARAALSFGLSVALIPLLALLLDKLPWGIRPWPIAIALMIWIVLLCGVATWRRVQLAGTGMAALPPTINLTGWWRGTGRRSRVLYIAGVLLCAVVISGFALTVLAPPARPTEFYILGSAGLAEDYPRAAIVGQQLTVTSGIVNEDAGSRTYRIEVWAADAWDASRRALVLKQDQITLAPGQQLEQPISWRMPWAGDDQQVELLLFSGNDTAPYRQLKLWVNVKDS